MRASELILNAWNKKDGLKEGIYINSNPEVEPDEGETDTMSLLRVGNAAKGQEMRFYKRVKKDDSGKVTASTYEFKLTAGRMIGTDDDTDPPGDYELIIDTIGQTLRDSKKHFFFLGNDNEYIRFLRNGRIEIKTSTYTLSSKGLTIYKDGDAIE